MTTLLSWLSVDSRGPSSIYIVSDSRITWGSGNSRWDSGRKVFAATSADVFGYCGDVLFPSLVLGQLTDLIARELIWPDDCDAGHRHSIILDYMRASFGRRHNTPDHDFTIIHAARDRDNLQSSFHLWRIDYRASSGVWTDFEVDISNSGQSRLLIALGSGKHSLTDELDRWNRTPQGGTARSIFSAFCDALDVGDDPLSGGVPQLVALHRRSGGKVVGFVSDATRYIHGLPIEPLEKMQAVEWVDRLFQRISPFTLDLLTGAQRHARVEKQEKGGFGRFVEKTRN